MVRAVIFDFNGVLIDDESVHCDLFREVLSLEGVAMTERDYHDRYLGLDDRGCFEAALRDAGQSAAPAARGRDDRGERPGATWRSPARACPFFPHARRVPRRAGQAVRPGDQFRSALRPEIELALNLMERRDRIAAIVSAEEAERCKPDPQGIHAGPGKTSERGAGLAWSIWFPRNAL